MNQADNLMRSLNDQSQTIDYVASTFVEKFPELVYQLSKVVDRWFNRSNTDKKSICIQLICLIFKKSIQHNCANHFLKGLAQRLRFFLMDLSKNYVSEGVALNIGRNIDSLKFTGIFCDQYFQKLQFLARKIKENSSQVIFSQLSKSMSSDLEQKSYSRTCLIEFLDISQFQKLKAIYDTYVQYTKTEIELNQSKGNINDSENLSSRLQDSMNLKKANSQAGNIDDSERIQKISRIIENLHSHINDLRMGMQQEIQRYEQAINGMNSEMRVESQSERQINIGQIIEQ